MDNTLDRFTGLYDSCYRNVLRYALQHAEQGSAEDVASETFLIAWRQWPDIPEPPLPWRLGVARNLLRRQAAAGRRRRQLSDRIAALTGADDVTAWDAGEHVVARSAALEALAALAEPDIEALTLVTWHGLDARAAAAVAGCSPRAFTVRLHRARRRLAEAIRATDQKLAGQKLAGQKLAAQKPIGRKPAAQKPAAQKPGRLAPRCPATAPRPELSSARPVTWISGE